MNTSNEIKPTLEEIKAKLSHNNIKTEEERQFYELKQPQGGIPDLEDVITTIISFYNSLGGYLLIETDDLPKTNKWVTEHHWENTNQWKRNALSDINDKITIGEHIGQGKNYVILSINRAEHPFDFASYDGQIILRIGANKRKIAFGEGDVGLLKNVMEQRLASNSHKEAAKFWENFYEICSALFSNPALIDTSTSDLGENPTFKQCRTISINSQSISGLRELHSISVQLNAPADVKNAIELLISASDEVKARRRSEVCATFTLAEMYKNTIRASQNPSLDINKTREWLKRVKESG